MTLDVKKDRPMKEALDALFAKENRKFFLWGIGVFVVVLILPPSIFTYIAGENNTKLEFIKLIGWGMSGLIAILGVMGLFQRAAALDKQNEMTEKGHIHERFKVATEHLGSEHISVRIAAFNEFYHLAEIESNLRKTIFDILCAHLRQTTKDENYKYTKPTEEVQSLLDILFKPQNSNDLVFGELNADLAGVNLQKADLHTANLNGAYLKGANLQGALLVKAELWLTSMKNVDLQGADLQKASMHSTHLEGAKLQNANLLEAEMKKVHMQGAAISIDTKMPPFWKKHVIVGENGKIGVTVESNNGEVIEHL